VALQRGQPQPGFSPDAVTRVFQADTTKLPSYIGAPNERGGFSIYKLIAVNTPAGGDPKRIDIARDRLGEQIGRELVNAYVASLKAQADVKINQEALEKR
jgi:peptidyl-prolyl cis-trans isomerase D